MPDIEVIDNFLDFKSFKTIQSDTMSWSFPWLRSTIIGDYGIKSGQFKLLCDPKLNTQFIHRLHRCPYLDKDTYDSPYQRWSTIFFPKLNIASVLSAKINFNPMYTEKVYHGFHRDNPFDNAYTAVYYINTNNGVTAFEDGTEVKSVANRLVKFPSYYMHTGSTCTDEHGRYVMNLNYFAAPDNADSIISYG